MTTKSPEEIRSEWVEKTQNARQQQAHLNLLNSCSEADKAAVAMLEKIDIASGGQLDRLVAVYRSMKVTRK